MADALQSARQDVEQEAPEELGGGQPGGAHHVAVSPVSVGKAHVALSHLQDPVVGDRHAVGVARKITKYGLGP